MFVARANGRAEIGRWDNPDTALRAVREHIGDHGFASGSVTHLHHDGITAARELATWTLLRVNPRELWQLDGTEQQASEPHFER